MSSATELCRRPEALSDEARGQLQPGMPPVDYVRRLSAMGLHADAVQFLAQAVPPREAVWWGCLCVEHAGAGQLPEVEEAALGATVRWVLQPSEDSCAMARDAGERAGSRTPAGCLAKAAGQAGYPKESGQPLVPPRPDAVARMVAAGVAAAARRARQRKILALPQYVELGLQAASGQLRWTADAKSRKQEVRS